MTDKTNVNLGIGVDLMKVAIGDELLLKDGRVGIVVDNIGDGQWVELRFGDDADPELIHSQDLDAVSRRATAG